MPPSLPPPSRFASLGLGPIGRGLAACYAPTVAEGVPVHLAALVRRMQVQEVRRPPLPAACALVVEPDRDVRLLAELILDDLGFVVVGCESAEAALCVMRAHGDAVALVYAELRLAGPMPGSAIARLVSARWPRTRMILASAGRLAALPAGVTRLPKPWPCADFLAEARRAAEPF